jgi:AcrR family transcriptional regulator
VGQAVRADARRNRARLVDAARELFAEVGIEAAGMNDVARRAGVGPGTLWRHFPNKEALVAEVVGESLDELAALADELRATEPPGALRTWAAALLGHVARYRGLATSLANASGDPLAGRCTATELAFERLVEHVREKERLRQGATATDITRLATAVAWAAEAAGDPASAERMLDLVFDGLTDRAECPR